MSFDFVFSRTAFYTSEPIENQRVRNPMESRCLEDLLNSRVQNGPT